MATKQFPYAAKVLRDYLNENRVYLQGSLSGNFKVATEVPASWSGSLVTVTSVPAGPSGHDGAKPLSQRRLIIHCWNSKELDAAALAERVRELLVDVPYRGVAGLRNVNIIGEPGRLDDPDTAMPRFQITVDVLLRATILN